MSQLSSTVRAARPAIAAVERARLALVPARRVDAPRAPFAVLVFLILGAGVVGLLMFNTQMQQDSFYATRLQNQADRLTAQQESLQMDLDGLRDPQHLAQAATWLGMVPAPVPAQINLASGKVEGIPTVATGADRIQVNPKATAVTPPWQPPVKHVVVTVKTPEAPATTTKTGQKGAAHGPASTTKRSTGGTNGAGTAAQGATR
ncbi:hypothetical protein [Nocardioides marmorisolisilvae]|uniref:Cell division protein FtsL n=1 Tax=Nocardioides marmorisolisilvae TaxID=1542737 RepID=A0A3N0DVU7_9ACTN|nr:hypothetical protein [Nocardioides marmorisolisilvae]RNL79728.1 hypothetical protein EFL95_12285 [Nocardioides marmorisolisilvae]